MNLQELGLALVEVPDDILIARLLAIGLHVGGWPAGPDLDQQEAQASQEDWWNTHHNNAEV